MFAHLPASLLPGAVEPDLSVLPHHDVHGKPIRRGVYRLTQDLANPAVDKRSRDFWAQPVIPAGTLVVVASFQGGAHPYARAGRPGRAQGLALHAHSSLTLKHAFAAERNAHSLGLLFFASAEPVPFTSAAQVLHDESHMAIDILDELVRQGFLTHAALARLAKEVLDRPDPDDVTHTPTP